MYLIIFLFPFLICSKAPETPQMVFRIKIAPAPTPVTSVPKTTASVTFEAKNTSKVQPEKTTSKTLVSTVKSKPVSTKKSSKRPTGTTTKSSVTPTGSSRNETDTTRTFGNTSISPINTTVDATTFKLHTSTAPGSSSTDETYTSMTSTPYFPSSTTSETHSSRSNTPNVAITTVSRRNRLNPRRRQETSPSHRQNKEGDSKSYFTETLRTFGLVALVALTVLVVVGLFALLVAYFRRSKAEKKAQKTAEIMKKKPKKNHRRASVLPKRRHNHDHDVPVPKTPTLTGQLVQNIGEMGDANLLALSRSEMPNEGLDQDEKEEKSKKEVKIVESASSPKQDITTRNDDLHFSRRGERVFLRSDDDIVIEKEREDQITR